MTRITVVDYGVGNLASICNMLKKLGVEFSLGATSADIATAEKLILPGVGAFDHAIGALRSTGLFEALDSRVRHDRVPVFGICLGMQLLTGRSEEGKEAGFGWLDAETKKLVVSGSASKLKVPHMGWNEIRVTQDVPLLEGLGEGARFYFVHSYCVKAKREQDVVADTLYGEVFHSVVACDNVFGAQFHPEKSHKYGMRLLGNFAQYC